VGQHGLLLLAGFDLFEIGLNLRLEFGLGQLVLHAEDLRLFHDLLSDASDGLNLLCLLHVV
jgi:hypothetical protein